MELNIRRRVLDGVEEVLEDLDGVVEEERIVIAHSDFDLLSASLCPRLDRPSKCAKVVSTPRERQPSSHSRTFLRTAVRTSSNRGRSLTWWPRRSSQVFSSFRALSARQRPGFPPYFARNASLICSSGTSLMQMPNQRSKRSRGSSRSSSMYNLLAKISSRATTSIFHEPSDKSEYGRSRLLSRAGRAARSPMFTSTWTAPPSHQPRTGSSPLGVSGFRSSIPYQSCLLRSPARYEGRFRRRSPRPRL